MIGNIKCIRQGGLGFPIFGDSLLYPQFRCARSFSSECSTASRSLTNKWVFVSEARNAVYILFTHCPANIGEHCFEVFANWVLNVSKGSSQAGRSFSKGTQNGVPLFCKLRWGGGIKNPIRAFQIERRPNRAQGARTQARSAFKSICCSFKDSTPIKAL